MAPDVDTCVLLVRHGATQETAERRYPSLHDLPLSTRGRLQAEALSTVLHRVGLEAIFASPSRRAQETAAPLVVQHNLELRVVPEIVEMGFGRLGGLSLDEAAMSFPAALKSWLDNPFEVTLPEGEAFLDFVG